MTFFFLTRRGYGTLDEIRQWDTPQFLDVIEYEEIIAAIEYDAAQKK